MRFFTEFRMTKIMINKNRKISNYAWIVATLFVLGVFAPSFFGMDGMNGGYALAVLSGFFVMASIVTAAVYGVSAKEQDRITTGRALLAHWTYSQKEWEAFTKDESVRTGDDKKILFYIIAAWAVFFGILFPILDWENGIYVTYMMLGLIALIWIVMKLAIRSSRNALKTQSEVYISRFGVYIAGTMLSWRMYASKLIQVDFIADKDCDFIDFSYQSGRASGNLRVPVPLGKMGEAKKIVEALKRDI